jgi:mevalonate kinase
MTQPKALRLADQLDGPDTLCTAPDIFGAAAELRRLHAVNQELLEALKVLLPGAEAMGWNTDKARAAIAKAEGETK